MFIDIWIFRKSMLFIIIFLSIANWGTIYYFLYNFLKPGQKLIDIKDKELINTAKKKTGLNIIIKIMEIDKMIGFMISSPPFPAVMVFSKKLFDNFNKDEKEWVILHESAHYFMWHSLKFAVTQFTLLFIGLLIIQVFNQSLNYFFPSVVGLILGLIYIRCAVFFEYEADNYAATHMDNPKGMITSNIKMRAVNKGILNNPFFKKLFIIAVPYEERIKMAETQFKLKKN